MAEEKTIQVPDEVIKFMLSGVDKKAVIDKYGEELYNAAISQLTMSKACKVCG